MQLLFSESCAAGQRLDQVDGCVNCSENQWSSDGNNAATCQICPSGKGVAAGEGRQESDCGCKFSSSFVLVIRNYLIRLYLTGYCVTGNNFSSASN